MSVTSTGVLALSAVAMPASHRCSFLGSFVFDWFGSWVIKALRSLSLKDIDDRVFVVSRRSS